MMNQDLMVVLLHHNAANSVQIAYPMCREASPHHDFFVVLHSALQALGIILFSFQSITPSSAIATKFVR